MHPCQSGSSGLLQPLGCAGLGSLSSFVLRAHTACLAVMQHVVDQLASAHAEGNIMFSIQKLFYSYMV